MRNCRDRTGYSNLQSHARLRAVLLCIGLGACHHTGEEGAPPPLPVRIASVESAEIKESSEYLATLKSRRSIVLQPQIDGQITEIFVAAGAHVQAGDAILQIDPARQAALVSSEESTRQAKLASLNYWKGQAERMARLYDGGAVSQQELQQARMSFESAKADVAAMAAQVQNQRVQLRYYRVVAPAAGIVGDIPVRVGDRVTPATRLTTLDNNEMLEAYVSVPAERAADLRIDLPVQLLDHEGALLADTKTTFVAPLVNDDTQLVLIKSVVENGKGLLRPGQIVRARVVWGSHRGPVIPTTGVIRLGGQYFAFLAEKGPGGMVAKQQAVALGELVGNRYAVRAGLKEGQQIVTVGAQKLRDGSPITEEK